MVVCFSGLKTGRIISYDTEMNLAPHPKSVQMIPSWRITDCVAFHCRQLLIRWSIGVNKGTEKWTSSFIYLQDANQSITGMSGESPDQRDAFLSDEKPPGDTGEGHSSCPMKHQLLPQGPGKEGETERPMCKYAHSEMLKHSMLHPNGSTASLGIPMDDRGNQCVLSFHSVGYSVEERVPTPGKGCCGKSKATKHILKNAR